MPTPVSTARQCLTEEAARALDDAVAVARRRSHAQTTSLHAVSALLSLPSSPLSDACARARSCAYSPRLQFRALELSVGVSLDRLPTSKTLDEPPISNSLMAAIKRSQANQRRHPETFHLYQQLQNASTSSSISSLKVELKHFILSILDDPIVSRVFGEAGFRSCDIKLTILNPPIVSRFSRARYPPVFLCNLSDTKSHKRGFSFPFSGFLGNENVDENSKRIGEVLVKESSKNPLLIGVCANDALNSFTESVQKGKDGILPDEIGEVSVISVGKEISEFVEKGGREETMCFVFKEVNDKLEACTGVGVAVNYGELRVLADAESANAVNYVVSQLSKLLEVHSKKLWLIGAAASYDTYMKFLDRFPSIQKDWDLHPLPITSSSPPTGGLCSRSSLMGSFVPFGGFFPTPSEFENIWSNKHQPTARCNLCNEKYEREVSIVLKGGSIVSVTDQHMGNLSSWLQKAECDPSKRLGTMEAKDDENLMSTKLLGLQRKWNEICQRLHHTLPYQQDDSQANDQHHCLGASQSVDASKSSNKDSLSDDSRFTNPSSCMVSDLQNVSPTRKSISKRVTSQTCVNSPAEPPVQVQVEQQRENMSYSICAMGNRSLPLDRRSFSNTSVTTDLGLGTLYASCEEEPRRPIMQEHKDRLHYVSGAVSSDKSSENASKLLPPSSSCSITPHENQLDAKDFKYLCRVLGEKVFWQEGAIYSISQTICRCRVGLGRQHSSRKGNIWLGFLGPDTVGKRKIAAALAENIFGSRGSLLLVDLRSGDGIGNSNSILDRQGLVNYEMDFRGKMVVDYIAEQLAKKSRSVVLLENIDKADFLVQNSLSQAIQTGKFPDLRGREVSINNMIFVITSNIAKINKNFLPVRESPEFSEETILAAKDLQMQILFESVTLDGPRTNDSNVFTSPRKGTSLSISVNKRKLIGSGSSSGHNIKLQLPKRMCNSSRACFDLNLPVQEMEEEHRDDECDSSGSESSKAWLEDFLDQVDEYVVFKPFDFDALAERILKEIDLRFQKIVGSNVRLEIDSGVMVQILAAAWSSEKKSGLEDWIDEVLSRCFKEAQQRGLLTSNTIVKLVACEAQPPEEHTPGIYLPARVSVS